MLLSGGLAGCQARASAPQDAPSGDRARSDDDGPTPEPSGASLAQSGASDGGPATTPYANVVAVKTSGSAGAYTFSVTVQSADIDCTQFANWWEVVSEDGALLYRRILEHSHTDDNGTSDLDAPGNTFTRTGGPVPVGEDERVIVRAHMSVGGYHGDVVSGTAQGGFDLDPEVGDDFAAALESQEPLPTGCLF
jgi:hypothetical protein